MFLYSNVSTETERENHKIISTLLYHLQNISIKIPNNKKIVVNYDTDCKRT